MSFYECEHGRGIGRCQECADEKDYAAKDAEIKVLREEVAILSRGIDRKNAERDFALDEIARLKSALARVTAQRDKLAIALADARHELSFQNKPKAKSVGLVDFGLLIENGEVKDIEG